MSILCFKMNDTSFLSKFSNNKFVMFCLNVMVLVLTTWALSWTIHVQHCVTVTGLQCTVHVLATG